MSMTSSLVRRLAGVAAVVTLAACGSTPAPSEPGESAPAAGAAWTRVPGVPLSPRTDPVVAWTGTEVLVVGGNSGFVCPPNADCMEPTDLAADGAAFDPASGAWRAIADAPAGLWDSWGGGYDAAVVGGLLVVRGTKDETWQAHDVSSDEWSTLTPPPGFEGALVSSNDRLWARDRQRILSWDPRSGETSVEATYAPDRPLQDSQLFVTPAGPVVTGVRYRDAAPDEPTLTQVDVPDGAGGWRRFETGQIGWLSHWDGSRLVGVEPGEADGGEVNGWDRAYPFAGTLDPVSGDWQPIGVPQRDWESDHWDVSAAEGTRIVAYGLYLDTAESGEWLDLGRPDSDLDHNLSATWAGDRLFVFGGVDAEVGYDAPSAPEAWLWTPR